jgi:hypothetical protein
MRPERSFTFRYRDFFLLVIMVFVILIFANLEGWI